MEFDVVDPYENFKKCDAEQVISTNALIKLSFYVITRAGFFCVSRNSTCIAKPQLRNSKTLHFTKKTMLKMMKRYLEGTYQRLNKLFIYQNKSNSIEEFYRVCIYDFNHSNHIVD